VFLRWPGHKIVPQVIEELKKYTVEDIMVVVGGNSVTGLSIPFAGQLLFLVLEQNQRCCYKDIRNPYRRLIDTLDFNK
jgi:hypothetical protein